MGDSAQITRLLGSLRDGDKTVLSEIIPLVYTELHRLADAYLRNERQGHTLQPTALVNEAYMRLAGQEQPQYQNRSHFFGVAAQVMRQILVDYARSRRAAKRGGGQSPLPIEEAIGVPPDDRSQIIVVDDALNDLAKRDPLKARLIELRFFGGMSADEAATYLNIPVNDVRKELRVGQAWLRRELERASGKA